MRRLAAVLFSAAFLVTGLAGPATAQTTGNQRFIVIISASGDRESSRVIAIGPITAVGTFQENEDPDLVEFLFPQGTITLFAPAEDESEDFNERACVGSFTFSGPVTIVGATGAFRGATGSGRVDGRGTFVADRTPDGCSEEEEGGSFFLYASVTANVTLPAQAAA